VSRPIQAQKKASAQPLKWGRVASLLVILFRWPLAPLLFDDDRLWQILLQKSFCTGDQKFFGP
jgi:hypothetical protein